MLENVKQIIREMDTTSKSDADWIKQYFAEHGYYVKYFLFDAACFGGIASRQRIYFIGWSLDLPCLPSRLTLPEPDPLDRVIDSFIDTFTIEPLPVEAFLILDMEELGNYIAEQLTPSKIVLQSSDCKWQEEHCAAFRELELPWPAALPGMSADEIDLRLVEEGGVLFTMWRGHWQDRNAELAYFLMLKFPFGAKAPPPGVRRCELFAWAALSRASRW